MIANTTEIYYNGAKYGILYNYPSEYLQQMDQITIEVRCGEEKNQNIEGMEHFSKKQGFITRQRPVAMLWEWRV